jgi:hypothetical protein
MGEASEGQWRQADFAEGFLSSLRDAGSSSSSSESAREIAGVPTGVAADDVQ